MNEDIAQKIVDALEEMVENCRLESEESEYNIIVYRTLNQAYNRALSILEGF